jgi:hypothetical protein
VTVDDQDAAGATKINVWDQLNREVAVSNEYQNLATVTFQVARNQSYIVDLHTENTETIDYTLDIRPVPRYIEQPSDEVNGSIAGSVPVTLPVNILGAANSSTDPTDYFRITPPASAWYRLTLADFDDNPNDQSVQDFDLYIGDEDENGFFETLASSFQEVTDPPRYIESIDTFLTAGKDYYVVVNAFATTSVRQYTLDLHSIPAPPARRSGGARSHVDLFAAMHNGADAISTYIADQLSNHPTLTALTDEVLAQLAKTGSDASHTRYYLDAVADYRVHDARDLANWFRDSLGKTLYPPAEAAPHFVAPSTSDLKLEQAGGGEVTFQQAVPTAAFTSTLSSAFAPTTLTLGGSPSSALGGIRSYQWSVDDGQGGIETATGEFAEFALSDAGTYTVRLIATSNNRVSDSAETTVTVLPPPTVTLGGVDVSVVEPPAGSVPASAEDTFQVLLSSASDRDVSVTLTSAGTAAVGADFQFMQNGHATSTVTVPAGQTSVDVTVRALFDGDADDGETASVQINSADGADVGTFTPISVTVLDSGD